MDDLPESDLLRFVEQAVALASRAVDRYSSKFSKKRYTLRQHVVRLEVKKTITYCDLVDELIEMPRTPDSSISIPSLPPRRSARRSTDRR
jgi:hypothetical protein